LARIELERILGRFRPIVRQILFLTLAEGLSHAEAAEVLGLSPAAVSKTVSRFRQKGMAGGFGPKGGERRSRNQVESAEMSGNPLSPSSNTAIEAAMEAKGSK
jgi:predicted transcriptional regulator